MKHIRGKKILLLTAIILSALWATAPAYAQTFTVLYTFPTSVNTPSSLTLGIDGNLYGSLADWDIGTGEIFRVSTSGEFTGLFSFNGDGDGANPVAPLLLGRDGNFYGTTNGGGANNSGTVFETTPGGQLTTLFVFDSYDGGYPAAEIVRSPDGDFYGTTAGGGASCEEPPTYGCGTVFKMTPIGELTTLYSFCPPVDCFGTFPNGLVQAENGNFYGTTFSGGASNCYVGAYGQCGTVFEITPKGKLTTLYTFCFLPNCADGADVNTGLILGNDGNLYGVTSAGGIQHGTIFRITPAGKFSTLYNFCSQPNCLDGGLPIGLMLASDGNFYGTTALGGNSSYCIDETGVGCGTIFQFTLDGQFTVLYNFCSQEYCADGAGGMLSQATSGAFYGTTGTGGSGAGTIFSFSTGLSPFIETVSTSGKVGSMVTILGTNLTGATSVTFNDTPATFQVLSPTVIEATVPRGATTGKVEVTTPIGQLLSNVAFRVL